LGVTAAGVVQRDEIVFEAARQRSIIIDLTYLKESSLIFCSYIPLVMLLSGGYQKTNARVIADSITSITLSFLFFFVRYAPNSKKKKKK
jgi:histone deacetylase 11